MGTVRLAKISEETIQNYQATRLKEGVSKRTPGMDLDLLRPRPKK
jgi:hypothetical protein